MGASPILVGSVGCLFTFLKTLQLYWHIKQSIQVSGTWLFSVYVLHILPV
jgi:hypothetical protein